MAATLTVLNSMLARRFMSFMDSKALITNWPEERVRFIAALND
jgi:hypothetical protein